MFRCMLTLRKSMKNRFSEKVEAESAILLGQMGSPILCRAYSSGFCDLLLCHSARKQQMSGDFAHIPDMRRYGDRRSGEGEIWGGAQARQREGRGRSWCQQLPSWSRPPFLELTVYQQKSWYKFPGPPVATLPTFFRQLLWTSTGVLLCTSSVGEEQVRELKEEWERGKGAPSSLSASELWKACVRYLRATAWQPKMGHPQIDHQGKKGERARQRERRPQLCTENVFFPQSNAW